MTASPSAQPFPSDGRRLIVYAIDDLRSGVEDHVLFALGALRAHATHLLVVANGSLTSAAWGAVKGVADEAIVREDVGSGIWAHAAALAHLGDAVDLYDEIVLTGDSWFGPLQSFAALFGEMDPREVDVWGITDRRDGVEGGIDDTDASDGVRSLSPQWVAARRRANGAEAWGRFWNSLPPRPHDREEARRVALSLSSSLAEHGLTLDAAYPEQSYPTINPSLFNPDLLIADGSPIVARDVFDGYPLFLDQHAIIGRRIVRAMDAAGYPIALLWRNLARTLAPKTLNANAAMFEVLPEVERVEADASQRILVVVHAPRLEGLDDLFDRVTGIPGRLHIVATVPDAAVIDAVREHWSLRGDDSDFEVRVAPGRTGADTAVVFAECRDLLEAGEYALVVAVHTGVPDGATRNRARYLRRHQIENLLSTPGYVANLLSLFAREPGLGLVFPPTPHIGGSNLGEGWGAHRARAEQVARALAIRVPFDWASPLAPFGGMWVGRPEAVRLLADHEWPARDAALIEVHNRLLAYAAAESGFHTRTVATGVHAGLSHNSLEFTLDQMSTPFLGYPAGYVALLHKAGPAGAKRGRDFIRMWLRYSRPHVMERYYRLAGLGRRALGVVVRRVPLGKKRQR